MPVLLVLIVLPLVEIALFVAIGGQIGIWGVLGLTILGALIGVGVLRGRLSRLPVLLRAGVDPATLLAGGALTVLGAGLLILPGFLTDALGLILLLPPVQRAVAARLARTARRADGWQTTIIEGEYAVRDPAAPDPHTPRLRPPPGH